jgi:son of sevenless-like protein
MSGYVRTSKGIKPSISRHHRILLRLSFGWSLAILHISMATLTIHGGHHPGFVNNSTNVGTQSLGLQVPANDDQYITTFFCRALYDYQTNDASSLSFHRGDIIEVLTQLESGWWDGLLGDERGWFPSNYVAVISDEEAEALLSASEISAVPHLASGESVGDLSQAAMSEQDRRWLEAEMEHASGQGGLLELANATMESPSQPSDFWMPQVTPDGQASITPQHVCRTKIFY